MSDRETLLDDLAGQFLRSYPRGSRLLAVSSPDAGRSLAFATDLAAAFGARAVPASAVAPDSVDADALRTRLITPFRTAGEAAVLIVSGDARLLDEKHRGMWHFAVWLLAGEEPPHTAASVLIDVTDPRHPSRRFADYCAVPPTYRT